MSEKQSKRLRAVESGISQLEADRQADARFYAAQLSAHAETERELRLRGSHRLRREQARLKRVQLLTLGTAVLCLAAALTVLLTTTARSRELPPVAAKQDRPVAALEPMEDYENQYIEEALLAGATRIDSCTVTHYDACVPCCGKDDGFTASGVRANPGVTVAVDPTVIPLGADVLVDYGDGELHYYRADDTGGAVKGNHIDLCVESHEEALALGRRTATVYWVEQRASD